ncbi:CTD nuclear envelope phosphatase 1A-like isoform X2 [Tachypleus tridentatus]|uniref:CTD nuclear envelope phosphatase 1A-like isoform X2 n=1 Tax=Tachypleus tridentatus TaxID=6853 RepID=UPI003FD357AE
MITYGLKEVEKKFISMLKQVQMGFRAFLLLTYKIWNFVCYVLRKQARTVIQHQTVKYNILPLSPLSRHRLSLVKRKTMVLDLDETLIHSQHDGVIRNMVKPGTPPDFVLKVTIDRHPVRFFVHKRPHVDFFLDIHCTLDYGSYTKDLSAITDDLSSIFILDNSPGAYRAYPDNAIPIKSWFSDPTDTALLNLLPFLDALRFTSDVRSVLSRNLHHHHIW